VAFTDSHAHLDDDRFKPDRAEVLSRARQAGVERILTIGNGTCTSDFEKTLELLESDETLWAALGVHPHEAGRATESLIAELEDFVQTPRVLAWGEIGLDYHYDHSPRPVQETIFRRQLQGARALKLPVIIHCREAWDDCLQILAEEWASSGLGGILHCFSGTLETARRAAAWGFLISFAGNVTFPRAEDLRAVARGLPPEQLLIETDCPYLAPQAVRGRRNEPAFVVDVAAALGRLHGRTGEEMGALTSENFLRLFPHARA
jgi:TatD DNase family protein